MPSLNFYKHCLSDDLQEQVTAQLRKLIPEQLSLNEEVAIDKARCADLISEWSVARTALQFLEKSGADLNTLSNARARVYATSERLAGAFKNHKDIVLTAAATEAKAREVLNERTLMLFMNSVIDLVHEYFNKGTEESKTLMENFENDLRERIVVQDQDNGALAVEVEFYDMLNTIPASPDQQLGICE